MEVGFENLAGIVALRSKLRQRMSIFFSFLLKRNGVCVGVSGNRSVMFVLLSVEMGVEPTRIFFDCGCGRGSSFMHACTSPVQEK